MPYIEALSKRDDVEHVWVIAPRLAYSDRAAMGWPETWRSSSEKLTILIKPTDEKVLGILGEESRVKSQGCDNYAFFSGISAFTEVKHWFVLSLGFDIKRGIITEAPFTYDKPLWMHKLRFAIKDWRYVKYVDYVFAIGESCAEYYRGWSKAWKVVPFMYCTEFKSHTEHTEHTDFLNLVFVGSLDRRKNVSVLMKALSLVKSHTASLGLEPNGEKITENTDLIKVTIVGDGPERAMLEGMAKNLNNNITVTFVGAKPMEETQKIIAENDVLVLPSLHDGWGAVINEAMMLGTIPVCSDKCGAKYIIQQAEFGGVFDVDKPQMLAEKIEQYAAQINDLRDKRIERTQWAKDNISPEAVAEYFISSLKN